MSRILRTTKRTGNIYAHINHFQPQDTQHALISDRDHRLAHVIDNALLHLYVRVSSETRYMPPAVRNAVLVKYLKPFLKHPAFRGIKPELRSLLTIGRGRDGNLERKLVRLNTLSLDFRQRHSTDAHHLLNLMETCADELGMASALLDDSEPVTEGVIYMHPDDIDTGFDEAGKLVKPVSLRLSGDSEKIAALEALVANQGHFALSHQRLDKAWKGRIFPAGRQEADHASTETA